MAETRKRNHHRVYHITNLVHYRNEHNHFGSGRYNKRTKDGLGVHQPPLRGFMDDLTVTTSSHVQARWVLSELDNKASWARMKFNPKKSRCLILRKGKPTNRFRLEIQHEVIPHLEEQPIKCLGKWYDVTLNDRRSMTVTTKQAEEWLRKIEESMLQGKFKVWIYQHGLLPRLMWPLTLYEIPMTVIEGMERKVNKYLRRWLGIPPSFTSIGLFIRSGQLQLPISSLVEEYKVAKCRAVLTFRESEDDRVRGAGVKTRAGRKWEAERSVAEAESMLKLRDVIGNPCVGRQGLGTTQFQHWSSAKKAEKKEMIQTEIRNLEEEKRKARSVELGTQGAWTR
jgi:hypothetical protein